MNKLFQVSATPHHSTKSAKDLSVKANSLVVNQESKRFYRTRNILNQTGENIQEEAIEGITMVQKMCYTEG